MPRSLRVQFDGAVCHVTSRGNAAIFLDDRDRLRFLDTLAEVQKRDFKLDSFQWLKDDSLEDADELPPSAKLATHAIREMETAVEELNAVLALVENGNGKGESLLSVETQSRQGGGSDGGAARGRKK